MRKIGILAVIVSLMAVAVMMGVIGFILFYRIIPGFEPLGAFIGFAFGILADVPLYFWLRTFFHPPLPE